MAFGKCAICDSVDCRPCSRCGTVFYCCKDHRKMHWAEHKDNCKPYRIDFDEKLGRYMAAARNIQPGELILRERPAVIGPKTNSDPVCLGCFQVLTENYRLCDECEIAPVCGTNCQSKYPHADYECEYYRKCFASRANDSDFIASNMQLVMPLKCLAFKSSSKFNDSWEKFIGLESHLEKRERDPIWNYYEENILKVLSSFEFLKKKDVSLIQKICGILDVNCFELRGPTSTDPSQNEQIRGIYTEAAFMSHDCIGNTHVSVDDGYEMTIRASLPIKTGQAILFNYSNPFENTIGRLRQLKVGKYFDCTCERCSDPTELGTYMGSIICPRCHDGHVISRNSLSNSSKWFCEKCNREFYGGLVQSAIAEGRSLVEETGSADKTQLEILLEKCSKSFPQTGVVVVDIKQKLLASLHDEISNGRRAKDNVLKRNISLCQDLVHFLEMIEPGISRHKGITLYQLHKPKLILAKKAYESNEMTSKVFSDRLQECENILKHAISILIYEPHNSPEGRLLNVALNELKKLREDINNIDLSNERESSKKKN